MLITYSDPKGAGRVHYYYDDDGKSPMTPDMVYAKASGAYAIYNWYSGAVSKMGATNTIGSGYEGHVYAVVSPIEKGWAFIGEVLKDYLRIPAVDSFSISLLLILIITPP